MFEVEYKGGNAVIITTKGTRVAFDANTSMIGVKNTSLKGDVEIATEPRFLVPNSGARVVFEGPGEYEVGDVAITGIAAMRHIDNPAENVKKTTIYKLTIGDVRLVIIGNIVPELSEKQLEDIGVVDIAILPVGGGGYTLDATSASAIVRQVEPKIVVPVHYADMSLKYEVPQDEFQIFAKELGASVDEVGAKWKVKTGASLSEQLTVVKIDRS